MQSFIVRLPNCNIKPKLTGVSAEKVIETWALVGPQLELLGLKMPLIPGATITTLFILHLLQGKGTLTAEYL